MLQVLLITNNGAQRYLIYDPITEARTPVVHKLTDLKFDTNLYEDKNWLNNLKSDPTIQITVLATLPSYYEILLDQHAELFL